MKARSYSDAHIPCVSDVEVYRNTWMKWWTACQPSWRQDKGWPFPKEPAGNTTWGKLSARGKNGLFLIIMSTTWWAASLKSASERTPFEEAVNDIRWVIEQQLKAPSAPSMPATNENAPATSKTDSSAVPVWLQRQGGKRMTKPSRRLLEALT